MFIPSGVASIERSAFCMCTHLSKVVFQKNSKLAVIGNDCFRGSGLQEFCAPSGLKVIADGAFRGCKNLKLVVLNKGLKVLGKAKQTGASSEVFRGSGLEKITLPHALKQIDGSMLKDCKNLKLIWKDEDCAV